MWRMMLQKRSLILKALPVFLLFSLIYLDTYVHGSEEHGRMEGIKGEMGEMMHSVKVPEEYHGLKNPYWSDLEAIIEGSSIYRANCAVCHGRKGRGDGPAARTLNPKPFNFFESRHMAAMDDDYLFWRVSEGGAFPPFNSAMPAFKNALSKEEIWKVISFEHAISHSRMLIHKHKKRDHD